MSDMMNHPPLTWEPEQFEQTPPIDWGKVTDRATMWVGIITAGAMLTLVGFIAGMRIDDGPQVIDSPPVHLAETIDETSPQWNCLTMGNKVCGGEWEPVETATVADGSPLLDVITEGERQEWDGCMVRFGDTTTIVCPDGYTEVS